LRFSDGDRIKVKGEEYCRIYRLVSPLTPLAMWEAMQAGDDLEALRRDLPEEFRADFDAIIAVLQRKLDDLIEAVRVQAELVAGLSDKEVRLRLDSIPTGVRRFIFPYGKSGGNLLAGRTCDLAFRITRPDANRLEGYVPSYAMNRVMEESS
jgi:putative RNA ligase